MNEVHLAVSRHVAEVPLRDYSSEVPVTEGITGGIQVASHERRRVDPSANNRIGRRCPPLFGSYPPELCQTREPVLTRSRDDRKAGVLLPHMCALMRLGSAGSVGGGSRL